MSNTARVKAGYLSGYPIRCSMCHEMKDAGRVYDIDRISIPDPMSDTFTATGSVTICEACREDFHRADLELDAPEMERRARERAEDESPRLVSEAACDRLEALNRSHWTFPPDKG